MRERRRKGVSRDLCKCGNAVRFKQRNCNVCHAANMRAKRKKHSELPEEQRKNANARAYLHVYIKRGKIVKGKCMYCEETKVEAHHHNYDKPLEVIWMCRKHHVEHHSKVRKPYQERNGKSAKQKG